MLLYEFISLLLNGGLLSPLLIAECIPVYMVFAPPLHISVCSRDAEENGAWIDLDFTLFDGIILYGHSSTLDKQECYSVYV